MYIDIHEFESDFYAFHNGDILFNYDLIETLRAVKYFKIANILRTKIFLCGKRTNFKFNKDKNIVKGRIINF